MAGRKPLPEYPLWSIDPYDSRNRTTCAHISIIIKRNPDMTLYELAEKLAKGKHLSVEECLEVLQGMRCRGHLGYFDEEHFFRRWAPRVEGGVE